MSVKRGRIKAKDPCLLNAVAQFAGYPSDLFSLGPIRALATIQRFMPAVTLIYGSPAPPRWDSVAM